MVVHNYKCTSCNDVREYRHGMFDDPAKCGSCGSPSLLKLIGLPNVGSSKKGSSGFNPDNYPNDVHLGGGVHYHTACDVRQISRDLPGGHNITDTKIIREGRTVLEFRNIQIDLKDLKG